MPKNIMCDVCEGSGQETDAGGFPIDCHLCEGSGFLDWDETEDAKPWPGTCAKCGNDLDTLPGGHVCGTADAMPDEKPF